MRDSLRMQRFRDFINFHRNRNGLVLNKPIREKHLVSVLCSLMTIVCVVVALSMQQWAVSGSSLCDCSFGLTKVHCTTGISTEKSCSDIPMTSYYRTSHEILISCVLSISVLTMISSSVATVISVGFPREKLEFLRHYSVFNIVSLLCIILVAGFWLAVINSLPIDEDDYRSTVRFGYAFYIYLCSGLFTLIATCLNLLLAKTAAERRRQYRNRFRNRVMLLNNNNPTSSPPPPPLTNVLINEDADCPPEYTEATTSFIEEDDNDNMTSDTDPLVTAPPPYVP